MFKKIIEWFVKMAWPVILKFLIKYSDEIIEFIFKTIIVKMNQKRQKQQTEQMAEAEKKFKMAKEEIDPELKKQYYDDAVKQHEQASSFEEKMNVWNDYLNSIKEEIKEEILQNTKDLKAEDIFETGKKDKFDLKDKSSYLQIEAPKYPID